MNAVTYFNGYIPPHEEKTPTRKFHKILKKELKKELKNEERKQRIRIDHLSEQEKQKVLFNLTLSSHYLEGFIECLDYLEEVKLLGSENDLLKARDKLLKAQEFFITEAMKGGEEMFMARQNQQIRFEKMFKAMVDMNLDQLDAMMNFAQNIKHQKSKK